jgi:hypothetical protein
MTLKYIAYGLGALGFLSLGLVAMSSIEKGKKEAAVRILEEQGIEVETIRGAFFGCSEDDVFKYRFEGYNTNTKQYVKGNTCSGWVKGTTIRFQ